MYDPYIQSVSKHVSEEVGRNSFDSKILNSKKKVLIINVNPQMYRFRDTWCQKKKISGTV